MQWVNDCSAVRIDQDPNASDHTADVLDVENGAATLADIVPWVQAARVNFTNGTRPGQRQPLVYCNRSTLSAVANTLEHVGMSCPIWVASPGMSEANASSEIVNAAGPFPIYGVQYAWTNTFDRDVFQTAWLTTVSGKSGDTVSPGSYGPAVTAAQVRVNVWAAKFGLQARLLVDGCFGLNTEVAVKAFQGYKGLTVDGVIGSVTWTALNAAPDPVPPSLSQTGTVHSLTTGGDAAVTSSDGGWTWKFTGTAAGSWKYQCGTVHSVTTNSDALAVTDDGGLTWHYAGSP